MLNLRLFAAKARALVELLSSGRRGLVPALAGSLLLLSACAASRGASVIGADYQIATGDLLAVTVYQVEPLSKDYRVDMAGNIALPLIGDVAAVGRTTDQLRTEITQRLGQRYLRNPNVTVSVKDSTNNNVTLEGGVRQPGLYPITGPTTLLQAVALGRGIDPQQGNPRRVAIMRRIQGQRMAAAFDLEAIRSGQSQDPDVYPGDIVVVQSNNRRGFFQDILQALPLFAIFRPF